MFLNSVFSTLFSIHQYYYSFSKLNFAGYTIKSLLIVFIKSSLLWGKIRKKYDKQWEKKIDQSILIWNVWIAKVSIIKRFSGISSNLIHKHKSNWVRFCSYVKHICWANEHIIESLVQNLLISMITKNYAWPTPAILIERNMKFTCFVITIMLKKTWYLICIAKGFLT